MEDESDLEDLEDEDDGESLGLDDSEDGEDDSLMDEEDDSIIFDEEEDEKDSGSEPDVSKGFYSISYLPSFSFHNGNREGLKLCNKLYSIALSIVCKFFSELGPALVIIPLLFEIYSRYFLKFLWEWTTLNFSKFYKSLIF